MPAAKKLSAYPRAYWIIAEQVATGQVMESRFETLGEALTFRNRIYGFKSALERRHRELSMMRQEPMAMVELEDVARTLKFAEQFAVKITAISLADPKGPTKVEVLHKEHTDYAKMLNEMIATARPNVDLSQEADQSLERLLKMQKEGK